MSPRERIIQDIKFPAVILPFMKNKLPSGSTPRRLEGAMAIPAA